MGKFPKSMSCDEFFPFPVSTVLPSCYFVSFSMFLFVGSYTYTSWPCILCEIPVLFLLFSSAVVTTSNIASQTTEDLVSPHSASHYLTSPPLILPQRFASGPHYTFQ